MEAHWPESGPTDEWDTRIELGKSVEESMVRLPEFTSPVPRIEEDDDELPPLPEDW
jgi:hypothetical protein